MKEQLPEIGKEIAMEIGTIRSTVLQAAPRPVEPAHEPVVIPRSQPVDIPENFVLIRGGEFTMGSPTYEDGRRFDENLRKVTVSDFFSGMR